MMRLLPLAFGLLLAATASAVPLIRELGEGLGYARATQLPGDLPDPAKTPGPALVLDLRNTPADAASAQAFAAWLALQDRSQAPLIVLLNTATGPSLRLVLQQARPQRGVITLGTATSIYAPDVAVDLDDAADQRAYAALTAASTIADLISRKLDKPRHDESTLGKSDRETPEHLTPEELAQAQPAGSDAPHDVLLARAVHLHRALRALGRL